MKAAERLGIQRPSLGRREQDEQAADAGGARRFSDLCDRTPPP